MVVKMSTMLRSIEKVVATETIRATSTVYHSQSFNASAQNKKLVLDNVAFHKSKIVKECSEDRDIDLCLPPYCPWFNPVEFAFSVIKTRYRRLNVDTLVVWKH
jgi:transposase